MIRNYLEDTAVVNSDFEKIRKSLWFMQVIMFFRIYQKNNFKKKIANNDAESYKAKDNLDKLLSGNGIYKYQQEDYFEVTGFTQAIKEKLGKLKQDAVNYIKASKDTGNKVSFINENTLAVENIIMLLMCEITLNYFDSQR